MQDSNTVVTNGSTYDNCSNLSARFLDVITKRYEGTRLGRQEIYAEVLDDNPGALFRPGHRRRARAKNFRPDSNRGCARSGLPRVQRIQTSGALWQLGRMGETRRTHVIADESGNLLPAKLRNRRFGFITG